MPRGIWGPGPPVPCLTLLQIEGDGRTPPAAPAAQGGEMPSDRQTISCSFWLQIKVEGGWVSSSSCC